MFSSTLPVLACYSHSSNLNQSRAVNQEVRSPTPTIKWLTSDSNVFFSIGVFYYSTLRTAGQQRCVSSVLVISMTVL